MSQSGDEGTAALCGFFVGAMLAGMLMYFAGAANGRAETIESAIKAKAGVWVVDPEKGSSLRFEWKTKP